MTITHTHACRLCAAVEVCAESGCTLLANTDVGLRRDCSSCSSTLDEIDRLPTPRRPPLAHAQLIEVVTLATRRALDVARTHPERARRAFENAVLCLAPVDPSGTDVETWARLGAHAGACDGWTLTPWRMPADAPAGQAALAYMTAWTTAFTCVTTVRGVVKS